jgi:hypothetical protein
MTFLNTFFLVGHYSISVFLEPIAPMVNRVVPIPPRIPNSSSAAAGGGSGGDDGFQDHDEKVIMTEYTRRQRATSEELQSPNDGDVGVAGWWERDNRAPADVSCDEFWAFYLYLFCWNENIFCTVFE